MVRNIGEVIESDHELTRARPLLAGISVISIAYEQSPSRGELIHSKPQYRVEVQVWQLVFADNTHTTCGHGSGGMLTRAKSSDDGNPTKVDGYHGAHLQSGKRKQRE